MHASIDEIDRAARTLLEALAEHQDALAGHFEPGHLDVLRVELVRLRQALLGVQMGPLYWDAQAGEDADETTTEPLPSR